MYSRIVGEAIRIPTIHANPRDHRRMRLVDCGYYRFVPNRNSRPPRDTQVTHLPRFLSVLLDHLILWRTAHQRRTQARDVSGNFCRAVSRLPVRTVGLRADSGVRALELGGGP